MKTPQRGIDDIDLKVAARLRMRRLKLGLEPRLLDLAIGEPIGTLEKIENGERRLGAAQLFRLTQVLSVDVSYFFNADLNEEIPAFVPVAGGDNRTLLEALRFMQLYISLENEEVRASVRALVASLSDRGSSS